MRASHIALAVLIAAIWGINFVAIHVGLQQLSPQLLCMVRFLGASMPALFFIKRPAVPFWMIAGYGLTMFALQFIFLFIGMHLGITPALSSLLMQLQVFFTIFLAYLFLQEQPRKTQIFGALVSFSGIVLVGLHLDSPISLLGFMSVIIAAFSLSVGNLISKKIGCVNMFALVVWGSFVAWIPLFLLVMVTDGLFATLTTIRHLSFESTGALFYITYISTVVGYVGWSGLLSKYPTIMVAPFRLLVPMFAFLGSAFFLPEPLQSWKLTSAALVITGLCINLLVPRFIILRSQALPQEQ